MSVFAFSCEGATIRIRASGAEALRAFERLAKDFENFGAARPAHSTIEVELVSPKGDARPRGRRLAALDACSVHGIGSTRDCEYTDGTLLRSKRGASVDTFEIWGDAADGIHESAFEAILSALGEKLDRRGIHRVHALGLEGHGKSGLVLLPSGGGKSTLAALIASGPSDIHILSEETPLVAAGKLLPFPLRLSVFPEIGERWLPGHLGRRFPRRRFPRTKLLYGLDRERIGKAAPPSFLLVGGLERSPEPAIAPLSRAAAFAELFRSLVIGFGIAQMKEHLIRADSLPILVRIAFLRLGAALSLTLRVPAYRFRLSENPEQSLRVLRNFLAREGLSGAGTLSLDYGESPEKLDRNLFPAVTSARGRKPQIPLPPHGRGLPLGRPEPADHVRSAEHDLPPGT